ncbi:MAG: hypothetical protein QMD32_09860 [Smithellaceae bacterium]|nr:hypothetical protein [Smithellaceae bacterium]
MKNNENITELDAKIASLRQAALDVMEACGAIEAVKRNIIKIMACTRMLELNVTDARNLEDM